jgi:hypothetical protein
MPGILDELDNNVAQNREVDLPDDPGPALADRTPVVGSVRRSFDAPVIRDQLKD